MKISYARLGREDHLAIEARLEIRKRNYLRCLEGTLDNFDGVLIVGDKPGPSAPKDPGYHHTPFYSTKHCSGWLNSLLHIKGIPEEKLVWINSADKDGNPTDFSIVEKLNPDVTIALGGNAAKWLTKNGKQDFIKHLHPQFWKRFRNSEPYTIVDILSLIPH
jgi:hypothetical protein